jgi:hypothetical protein
LSRGHGRIVLTSQARTSARLSGHRAGTGSRGELLRGEFAASGAMGAVFMAFLPSSRQRSSLQVFGGSIRGLGVLARARMLRMRKCPIVPMPSEFVRKYRRYCVARPASLVGASERTGYHHSLHVQRKAMAERRAFSTLAQGYIATGSDAALQSTAPSPE